MAAFDFPASPTDGQEYSPAPGVTYVWHDPAWQSKSGAGGGAATFVGADPPPSPTPGMLWFESDSGKTFIWYDDGNTQQWVQISGFGVSSASGIGDAPNDGKQYGRQSLAWTEIAGGGGAFLPLTGGELSGDLKIKHDVPFLYINNTLQGSAGGIIAQRNGVERWQLSLGNPGAESSGNAGSDFELLAFSDTGGWLRNALNIRRSDGLTTLRGPVAINADTSYLLLDTPVNNGATIALWSGGKARWGIAKSSGDETGVANAGAAFVISAYADDGAALGGALSIERANQNITVYKTLGVQGDIWANNGHIIFPPVDIPASNANTLDDYDEVAWVPSLMFGGAAVGMTYGARAGRAQRVGNTVRYWGRFALSAKGTSTGAATIGGLPYVSAAGGNGVAYYPGVVGYWGAAVSMTNTPVVMVYGANTILGLWHAISAGLSDANFATNTDTYFSGSYEV